jgi:hypothetical protein
MRIKTSKAMLKIKVFLKHMKKKYKHPIKRINNEFD